MNIERDLSRLSEMHAQMNEAGFKRLVSIALEIFLVEEAEARSAHFEVDAQACRIARAYGVDVPKVLARAYRHQQAGGNCFNNYCPYEVFKG